MHREKKKKKKLLLFSPALEPSTVMTVGNWGRQNCVAENPLASLLPDSKETQRNGGFLIRQGRLHWRRQNITDSSFFFFFFPPWESEEAGRSYSPRLNRGGWLMSETLPWSWGVCVCLCVCGSGHDCKCKGQREEDGWESGIGLRCQNVDRNTSECHSSAENGLFWTVSILQVLHVPRLP